MSVSLQSVPGLSRWRRSVPLLFLASLVVAGASSLQAQQPKMILVEPPVPLLPQHFSSWEMKGQATTGTNPAEVDSPAAAVLKEDGLDRYSTASYERKNGGTLEVTALQFVDATGAYSAYTFYRSPKARPVPGSVRLGNQSTADGDGVLILAGTSLLRVKGPAAANELQPLAASMPKIGGPKGLQPLLPTYLPTKGLASETVHYSLGPAAYKQTGGVLPADGLGWDKSAEVITAEYPAANGRGLLTLLLYPTPTIAGEHGRAIEADLKSAGDLGTTRLRRVGPLVGLTTGAFSAAQADDLISQLHLRGEVTWNKQMPLEFHAEVKKTAGLLYSIGVFCGVGMTAAVLLGLFLGGGRAALRVMMGKPAATEPEFLRLGLRDRAGDGVAGGGGVAS